MNITINIHLDTTDVATLGPKLAAITRGLALLQTPEPLEQAPLHETPVLAPETPASSETPKITAIPQPTQSAAMAVDPPRKASGDRLAFEQFDSLVRKEVKRLSMDGRIPNAKLWDSERDPRLPAYAAVMARYGCTSLASFAEKMGMQPPIGKGMTINVNGANAVGGNGSAPVKMEPAL